MLRTLQAGTGLVIALFLILHLTNTWIAGLGPGAYDGVQTLFRTLYQFAPFEALLLAAIAVHGVCAVLRWLEDPGRPLTMQARLHRWAGIFLLVAIGGHILAVRGSGWFYDAAPGFDGVAFTLTTVPGYFYPYYLLLALAGFYHGLNGSAIAARRLAAIPLRLSVPVLGMSSLTAGLLTAVALMGFGGVLFEVGPVHESAFAELATRLAREWLGVELVP